jgi:hypothetical protein
MAKKRSPKFTPRLYGAPTSWSWESSLPATAEEITASYKAIKRGDEKIPQLYVPTSDPSVPSITSMRNATRREVKAAFKELKS